MAFWNSALHPRDRLGRFVRKGNIGVRVSTRSVSVTAGQRIAIVPGRVNLYVGGLVRLENASRSQGPIDKMINRIQDRAINALPDGAVRTVIGGLVQEGRYSQGRTLVSANTGRRSTPTIRVTQQTGASSLRSPNSVQTQGINRAPRRKPRTRSQTTRRGNTMDTGTATNSTNQVLFGDPRTATTRGRRTNTRAISGSRVAR